MRRRTRTVTDIAQLERSLQAAHLRSQSPSSTVCQFVMHRRTRSDLSPVCLVRARGPTHPAWFDASGPLRAAQLTMQMVPIESRAAYCSTSLSISLSKDLPACSNRLLYALLASTGFTTPTSGR
ncbi:uncharacterized protein SCHCODRAFT_02300125 [Schizophyllum commune H4-8]|uniref:uncharacterized protein n=1 Tax=Schizophyllum commune (strain H4-8 / FGSC 9210) TaxID=578458 RepID=UPI0021603C31|nr:uncharacterized protein SCHCODRAFT_02300125 [Schizophyllum commune H4-8]KAI5892743.1 hypothetical protein SCHCODRAFT_02300125 [Schizophyllum commune H4-8]